MDKKSSDLINFLKEKRQNGSDYIVEKHVERREEAPKIFTQIHVNYIIRGKNISREAIEKAIQLSYDKRTFKTGEITTSYEIIQE